MGSRSFKLTVLVSVKYTINGENFSRIGLFYILLARGLLSIAVLLDANVVGLPRNK